MEFLAGELRLVANCVTQLLNYEPQLSRYCIYLRQYHSAVLWKRKTRSRSLEFDPLKFIALLAKENECILDATDNSARTTTSHR
jgi:hypothetical protein